MSFEAPFSKVSYANISENEVGQRLDNYLIRILKGVPKTYIYRIIRKGEVRVNKKRAEASLKLSLGDVVRIPPVRMASQKPLTKVKPSLESSINNAVIYEDDTLLVMNKPSGMPVHGGSGLSFGVIEALRKIREKTPYLELIHRLDKETSGVLLIAKKRSMLRRVQALFHEHQVQKTYVLLSHGIWQGKHTRTVDLPLQKNHLKSNERMVQVNHAEGKASITDFRLLASLADKDACLIEAKPHTGRTHQIRVHAASMGHSIVGDEKYGKKEDSGFRLMLHARAIQFTLDGRVYSFEANWDKKYDEVIQSFGYCKTDYNSHL